MNGKEWNRYKCTQKQAHVNERNKTHASFQIQTVN